MNMRPGDLQRSLERWQARAKDMQRLQDKKEHAWDLYSRMPKPNFRLKNKENFEEDFKHRAVYDGKVNERKLQEWIDEMQPKVHAAECQLEARTRKRERERGWSRRTPVRTGDEHGRSCFSDDSTLARANHLSLTVSLSFGNDYTSTCSQASFMPVLRVAGARDLTSTRIDRNVVGSSCLKWDLRGLFECSVDVFLSAFVSVIPSQAFAFG